METRTKSEASWIGVRGVCMRQSQRDALGLVTDSIL